MIQVLAAAAIVIHAGGLLADPGEQPLREQTIVVSDGKISAVENGYQPPERYGADARLIDLKSRFVEAGSDWIKMTVSGSGGAPSGLADAEPIMLPEEVRAVTEAARRGLRRSGAPRTRGERP